MTPRCHVDGLLVLSAFVLSLGCAAPPGEGVNAGRDAGEADRPLVRDAPVEVSQDLGVDAPEDVPPDVASDRGDAPDVSPDECPELEPRTGAPCARRDPAECTYRGVICGPGMRHWNTAVCDASTGRWLVTTFVCGQDAGPMVDARSDPGG